MTPPPVPPEPSRRYPTHRTRGRTLTILQPGPLATLQDGGRPGQGAWGVGPSGAADRVSWAAGHRLLGNPPETASIEITAGGLSATVDATTAIVLTGAPAPASVDGGPIGHGAVHLMHPGQRLTVGLPGRGLRSYLAVRGGFAVDLVLGSRSTDLLAHLGPEPLRAGDRLPLGEPGWDAPGVDLLARPSATLPEPGVASSLAVTPGPRLDWFTAADREHFGAQEWEVTGDSDRVGVRLQGSALRRRPIFRDVELPSEPMVRGAVQIPPSGQPVVFLADCPVTGGYPVIAVLAPSATDHLAQVRPGDALTFRWS